MALIFGPFSSPTTLAVTEAPASSAGVASTVSPSTSEHRLERDLGPDWLAEQLDTDALALGHTLLLSTGLNDCVHEGETLPQNRVVQRHAPAAADRALGRERLQKAL